MANACSHYAMKRRRKSEAEEEVGAGEKKVMRE